MSTVHRVNGDYYGNSMAAETDMLSFRRSMLVRSACRRVLHCYVTMVSYRSSITTTDWKRNHSFRIACCLRVRTMSSYVRTKGAIKSGSQEA